MDDTLAELADLRLWRSMDSAPKDRFVILYCAEDRSRWWAKWQDGEWYGVDEYGLTRSGGYSESDDRVTGWKIVGWRPLPDAVALGDALEELDAIKLEK